MRTNCSLQPIKQAVSHFFFTTNIICNSKMSIRALHFYIPQHMKLSLVILEPFFLIIFLKAIRALIENHQVTSQNTLHIFRLACFALTAGGAAAAVISELCIPPSPALPPSRAPASSARRQGTDPAQGGGVRHRSGMSRIFLELHFLIAARWEKACSLWRILVRKEELSKNVFIYKNHHCFIS